MCAYLLFCRGLPFFRLRLKEAKYRSRRSAVFWRNPPSFGGLRAYPDMNLRQPIIIYQYRISAVFWRNKEVFLMAIESPRPPKPPIQPNAIRCTLYAVLNMQNKPNFRKARMSVNSLLTMNYKYFIPLARQKNKPNSNPIKPNFQKAKMNVNLTLTKDYRKKDDFVVRINKPNFQNAKK